MLKKRTPATRQTTTLTPPGRTTDFHYEMIVFSHLRWDFVYQRPQHLISRISQQYRTLFIEEPIPPKEFGTIGFDLKTISKNLNVLTPRVNSIGEIQKLFERLEINQTKLLWFYSPSFLGMLNKISAECIIYDCMDELSLFKGAPVEIQYLEKELLGMADLVLTGGVSLFESKSNQNDNVHCFPSSVDYSHFASAKNSIPIPPDMKKFTKPTIGYIGVIDERIDMDLLQNSAKILPEYDFVMIGPLAKITEDDLAKAENIHYLGMKDYDDLPNYLKAMNITMMPFALNDATRFISPTKTLEYMAAGKPIISTAIKDVVRHYSDCISIVNSAEEFKDAVTKIKNHSEEKRNKKYENILQKTSWDNTASEMIKLIKELV